MSRRTQNILCAAAAVLGLLAAVGVKTLLHPCVHADGSEAMCAGAGQLAFFLGLGLAAAGAGALLTRGAARMALAGLMLPLSVLLILAPGVLAPVCGMAEMSCRMVMQPGVRVMGALAAALSLPALAGVIRSRGE